MYEGEDKLSTLLKSADGDVIQACQVYMITTFQCFRVCHKHVCNPAHLIRLDWNDVCTVFLFELGLKKKT